MDPGIVNHTSLGPESGNFRAIHRPKAPNFRTVCRLARARVKGGGSAQGVNRIESGIGFGIRPFGIDRKPGPGASTRAPAKLAGAEGGPAGRPEDWNGRAGERGGARADKPRCVRILAEHPHARP